MNGNGNAPEAQKKSFEVYQGVSIYPFRKRWSFARRRWPIIYFYISFHIHRRCITSTFQSLAKQFRETYISPVKHILHFITDCRLHLKQQFTKEITNAWRTGVMSMEICTLTGYTSNERIHFWYLNNNSVYVISNSLYVHSNCGGHFKCDGYCPLPCIIIIISRSHFVHSFHS